MIGYLAVDDEEKVVQLSLLNDWDLDAAILSSSRPYLKLVAQAKPRDDSKSHNVPRGSGVDIRLIFLLVWLKHYGAAIKLETCFSPVVAYRGAGSRSWEPSALQLSYPAIRSTQKCELMS